MTTKDDFIDVASAKIGNSSSRLLFKDNKVSDLDLSNDFCTFGCLHVWRTLTYYGQQDEHG